ncbi:peptidase inhibitor family I36 protein [Leifsonia aquatica]|uniref:Uncharacterized protein n=1 Tax=Leifsonia aquatica TaxID=144185 RepID=A0A7W4UYF6_LEIAQ|nr:peptidase inhibitor family I36 protein [Leifsonia aquatica]MBB2968013.1 hypothetical protein [Leifsonia aquatica]
MRLVLSLVVATVLAATPAPTYTPGAADGGDYCAVRVEPLGSPESPASPACFNTQDEVDSYLAAVTSPNKGARAAAASVVIGTMYKDDNYGGGSYTFYGSGSCSGVTYGFPSLSADWQNTISSAKAFASCWVTLYDGASYGGSRYNCTPSCASLPLFNDRTKSIVFRPAGTIG